MSDLVSEVISSHVRCEYTSQQFCKLLESVIMLLATGARLVVSYRFLDRHRIYSMGEQRGSIDSRWNESSSMTSLCWRGAS